MQLADKQSTSPSSRFLDACRRFNAGELDAGALRGATIRLGFVNVLDAFHNVGGRELSVRAFLDERTAGGAILTEHLYRLREASGAHALPLEVEARWLVETAWTLNVGRNLIAVRYEPVDHRLWVPRAARRLDVPRRAKWLSAQAMLLLRK